MPSTNRSLVYVESNGSNQLEADLPANFTESPFSEPQQSAKAEQQTIMMITLDVAYVSDAEYCVVPVSGSVF